MKKRKFALVILLIACFSLVFSGCQRSAESTTIGQSITDKLTVSGGTWTIGPPDEKQATITFLEDRSFHLKAPKSESDGTYKIEKDNLILNYSDVGEVALENIKLSGDTLTVESNEEVISMKKQKESE